MCKRRFDSLYYNSSIRMVVFAHDFILLVIHAFFELKLLYFPSGFFTISSNLYGFWFTFHVKMNSVIRTPNSTISDKKFCNMNLTFNIYVLQKTIFVIELALIGFICIIVTSWYFLSITPSNWIFT